ncbi:cytochrome c biogenesis protein CcsA [Paenibacillus mucilaginosus]|uniref:Cytochrome c-type biogenesis protein CcsB n=3 Tax=Paenibacillus mucilaginosus TaxID=61624 RepID=H6NMI6_9BACL|nr:cytochrome c biogenesis protein CcsA [Paenibacillus mucilaginosus]AEI41302.1 cytochrome c-type biogenesis protein CcsB [Paenibacillus mucilaginosus KNP414]AFC29852.1 cytochrome c-type biogenesis protein CcsB [Paenibacillus mucilaginosus 3016]AFH62037.1 cytochrome C biogenesis protein [Paenibacillus mucilaginosus K02]WFA18517.1 c-type cytochrome biogenesis protein CcsB [Paenibacillus mucilaginosus]
MSSTLLLIAFIIYGLAMMGFVIAITGRWSVQVQDPDAYARRWGRIGLILTIIGFLSHLGFFFTRWAEAGHIPTSNMYEFMTFLAMMIVLAFIVVYLIYRTSLLGVFALPLAVIIIGYASVFPREIQPLIPALQSYWLKIHVTTAALGEAFFAVGFAGGLMYLLQAVDFSSKEKKHRREQRGVEFTIFTLVMITAFVASIFSFNAAGYSAKFETDVKVIGTDNTEQTVRQEVKYVLPPIVKPFESKTTEMQPFLGMTSPLFEAPSWMHGANAGRKLNTVVWSVLGGAILYGILRLIARKPLGAALQPLTRGVDPDDVDEIAYRAIAIGYPIFTLGALIFAMIWAHEAWGRFWGWDPKEVWALIVWLFYAAYLHLRLSRGWQGKPSAWLSVIGFLVVMFTLVGVNLVIAGLHSYSGT